MAYTTEELEELVLDAISDNELVFFNEIEHFVPSCKSTLEKHGLHKMGTIKEALAKNRVSTKKDLRNKWKESDNATVQVALYKLISDEDEFSRLSGQQIDHTSKGDKLSITINKNYNEPDRPDV